MSHRDALPEDPSSTALEHRLRFLEDRAAIIDLLSEYARRLDARDIAGYADLFTDDGAWAGNMGSAHGRSEIEDLLNRELAPLETESLGSYHLVFNPLVTVDGDVASAQSGFMHVGRDDHDRPVVALVGHYHDRLARTTAGWMFRSRRAFCDIPWSRSAAPTS